MTLYNTLRRELLATVFAISTALLATPQIAQAADTKVKADLVLVDGNPLANIANAYKVQRVIANGRLYELHELVTGPSPAGQ